MAIKSGTFYWLVCDKCGYRIEDDCVGKPLYDNIEKMLEEADFYGWNIEKDRHLCSDCAEDELIAEIYGDDEEEARGEDA